MSKNIIPIVSGCIGHIPFKDMPDEGKLPDLVDEQDDTPRVYVPKREYDFYGEQAVKAAADRLGVIVVPVEHESMEYKITHLSVTIPKPNPEFIERIFELKDPPITTMWVGKNLYKHYGGRSKPKDLVKKRKAKRRQQKRARRNNK